MSLLPPSGGRRLPPPAYSDAGPLPAQHSDVSVHLSDVSGPPAPPNRAPGAPMVGPTTVGGANAPAVKAPTQTVAPRPGGNGRTLGPKPGRLGGGLK